MHVPVFLIRHIFCIFSAGCTTLPSGKVTSTTQFAQSEQGWAAVGVTLAGKKSLVAVWLGSGLLFGVGLLVVVAFCSPKLVTCFGVRVGSCLAMAGGMVLKGLLQAGRRSNKMRMRVSGMVVVDMGF